MTNVVRVSLSQAQADALQSLLDQLLVGDAGEWSDLFTGHEWNSIHIASRKLRQARHTKGNDND